MSGDLERVLRSAHEYVRFQLEDVGTSPVHPRALMNEIAAVLPALHPSTSANGIELEVLRQVWREGRDWAVRRVEQQISDGYKPSGNDPCIHRQGHNEDCIGCYDEALLTCLTRTRADEPSDALLDAIAAPLPPSPAGEAEGLHTKVFPLGDDRLRAYKAMLVSAWDRLEWRHAGFGALQAYLFEGDQHELRAHIWHPDLVKPGIADSGLCHDHRFDMRSCVLVGEITNRDCELIPDASGDWETWEVLHARAAKEKTGESFHQDPTSTGQRYRRVFTDVPVREGMGYTFPKRAFHESCVKSLTITLIEKSNQEAFNARILAPHGKDIVHAFSTPLPSDGAVIRSVLADARCALSPPPSSDGLVAELRDARSILGQLDTLQTIASSRFWQAGGHWVTNIAKDAASRIAELEGKIEGLRRVIAPFARAIQWEEADGNFAPVNVEGFGVEKIADNVLLHCVAWLHEDAELPSADHMFTIGDLRALAAALSSEDRSGT